MADGIEARARRIKQLLKDRGIPTVKPRPIWVELLSHVLEPLGPLMDKGPCPEGAICYNVVVVPSGLHLPPEGFAPTKWHPTGETYDAEIDGEAVTLPVSRQVPNLVTTAAGAANVTPKPSRVDAPLSTGVMAKKADEPEAVVPSVTAEEIAMALAEAKAMRKGEGARGDPHDRTTPEERRIWGDVASRRTDRRIDTSWLWGSGGQRVVRSPVMPTWPAKE